MFSSVRTPIVIAVVSLAGAAAPLTAQAPQDSRETVAPGAESAPKHGRLSTFLRRLAGRKAAAADTALAGAKSQESDAEVASSDERRYSFRNRADSLDWVENRDRADKSGGFRLVVSLFDRKLWVLDGPDTLRVAPIAVAKGTTLQYGNNTWRFRTPRGMRKVLSKTDDPTWTPPDWLYAETATEYGLKMAHLDKKKPTVLSDGSRLEVHDDLVGIVRGDTAQWVPLRTDEHIVFDNTIFIPPVGTKNRAVKGELGQYRLDMGDGYMLHGTPYKNSIGTASTHGCVRLRDEDLEWIYEYVPVGTRVYIY